MQSNYYEDVIQLDDVLPPARTAAVIREALARGFAPAGASYPPSYRNNDRLVVDDAALAAAMFERLGPHLPATVEHGGEAWELDGLNSRWRFCRYRAGQEFTLHRDGAHHEGPARRSFLTVMFYLNDAVEFAGGATRFYRDGSRASELWLAVAPRRGTALVFPHARWHDGAPVLAGEKYIMRTDVMYRRRGAAQRPGHHGYVWSIAPLPAGRLASGGRDKTVRIWEGDLCTHVLRGHALSVTAVAAGEGGRLWSGSRDGELRAWRHNEDGADGGWRCAAVAQAHDGAIVAMASADAPDGRLATGGADGTIGLWRGDATLERRLRRHASWVWALAWERGELWSGSEDGSIVRGDRRLDVGRPVRALACAEGALVAGDADGELTVWGAEAGLPRRWRAHAGAITSIAALPGGAVASASEDGEVRRWDLRSGALLAVWRFDDHVRCLAVDEGGHLRCGGYDGQLHRLAPGDALAAGQLQVTGPQSSSSPSSPHPARGRTPRSAWPIGHSASRSVSAGGWVLNVPSIFSR